MVRFLLFVLLVSSKLMGQNNDFIVVRHNEILASLAMLETSISSPGSSPTYKHFLDSLSKTNKEYATLVDRYSRINFDGFIRRNNVPKMRRNYTTLKDLVWIACANAYNLQDLNSRLAGVLHHEVHTELIDIIKSTSEIYLSEIEAKEASNINRLINQIYLYQEELESLFDKTCKLYGVQWDKRIPFSILVYPLPYENGVSTAIPKGNALICNFMSHNVEDYKALLGVIIHEMCHIIYRAQSIQLQNEIDQFYATSKSKYATLCYSYLNEGLATAVGNGWAYKQIHGEMDQNAWYANEYIDSFAKSIYPSVEEYLEKKIPIDSTFLHQTILAFEKQLPHAIYRLESVMKNISVFCTLEKEKDINDISTALRVRFPIRYQQFSTLPITRNVSKNKLQLDELELFLLGSDHEELVASLNKTYPNSNIPMQVGSIFCFIDKKIETPVVVIQANGKRGLLTGIEKLSEMEYLALDRIIEWFEKNDQSTK